MSETPLNWKWIGAGCNTFRMLCNINCCQLEDWSNFKFLFCVFSSMKLMKTRVEGPALLSLYPRIWPMATSTTREKFINLGLNAAMNDIIISYEPLHIDWEILDQLTAIKSPCPRLAVNLSLMWLWNIVLSSKTKCWGMQKRFFFTSREKVSTKLQNTGPDAWKQSCNNNY